MTTFNPNDFITLSRNGSAVRAKFLSDSNGDRLINPLTGVGYVVPFDFDVNVTLNFATGIRETYGQNGAEIALIHMYQAFKQGGHLDIQRTYNGTVNGDFVPAFQDGASLIFGLVGAHAGFSQSAILRAGGLYNQVAGGSDTSGDYGNNPHNAASIIRAYKTVDEGRFGPPTYSPPRCFPGFTEIALPEGGTKAISEIRLGDHVLSFDPLADGGRGALVSGVVTRLFENVTQEWLRIDLGSHQDGAAGSTTLARRPLIATPGHEMLRPEGGFARLDQMVQWADAGATRGTVMLVDTDGTLLHGTVERISYSASTAHLFEQVLLEHGDKLCLGLAGHDRVMIIGVPDPRLCAGRCLRPANANTKDARHAG